MNADERETIVNASDGDDLVRIWTAQRRYITKMRNDSRFTETASGVHETTEWAEFTIEARSWSPLGVKRRVSLTEQQRNEARNRLLAANQARLNG